MTFEELQTLTQIDDPPPGLPDLLRALHHDARGRWDEAHRIVQDIPSPEGSWVHAYLHRKEGDLGNANYWYNRTGRPMTGEGLDSEWERIARFLVER